MEQLNCNNDKAVNKSNVLKVLGGSGKIMNMNEVPGLEHCYAEGVYITLTDLILLPCVTQLLVSVCIFWVQNVVLYFLGTKCGFILTIVYKSKLKYVFSTD